MYKSCMNNSPKIIPKSGYPLHFNFYYYGIPLRNSELLLYYCSAIYYESRPMSLL